MKTLQALSVSSTRSAVKSCDSVWGTGVPDFLINLADGLDGARRPPNTCSPCLFALTLSRLFLCPESRSCQFYFLPPFSFLPASSPFFSFPSFSSSADSDFLVSIKGLDVCHWGPFFPSFPPEKWSRFLLTRARLSSLKGFSY